MLKAAGLAEIGGAWTLPVLDPYAEREDPRQHWLDSIERAVLTPPRALFGRLRHVRARSLLNGISAREGKLARLSDADLFAMAREQRAIVRRAALSPPSIVAIFALAREVCRRTLGLRHHDVQILGGLGLLDGSIVEMDTGEGKTITAALAATAVALTGVPVHVISVNDYLVGRDSDTLRALYQAFGLSVGTIVQGLASGERRAAYACDITYASSKEIAFDYLRDRISHGLRPRLIRSKLRRAVGGAEAGQRPVMRGLHFAIVDEADSVLIDEARTPLIISRATEVSDERRFAEDAFRLIEDLSPGRDYRVVREDRRIELTDAGGERLAARGSLMGGHWESKIRREEAARQALSAFVLFHRGDQYLVREGRVEIIDEYTGRIMTDRSWSDGLHQLVEAKEGCEITSRKLPIARMTFQRFFRRYKRLGGMTGTAREAKREFWAVYKLPVRRVPPNALSQRVNRGLSICRTESEKWLTIRRRISEILNDQRAVLVGTRSVAASQKLSDRLLEAGIQHAVLNAEDDRDEASIIAAAGQVGRVTVATNMAGRGVDIKLTQALAERGGLHVILSERHDAKRIDRQLKGRAGRQGEQGSTEEILSLEDSLLDLAIGHPLRPLAKLPGGRLAAQLLFRRAQLRAERSHFRMRKDLLAEDRRIGTLLAFTGGHE